MKPLHPNWPVYVGWSQRLDCRGMQASRDIKKGELIEACPVILVEYRNKQERLDKAPNDNLLDNYYYEWNEKFWCIPMGYAMIYNHSYQPNMVYKYDYKNKLLQYVANIDIKKDEELTVNYNEDPADKTPIDSWFQEQSGKTMI